MAIFFRFFIIHCFSMTSSSEFLRIPTSPPLRTPFVLSYFSANNQLLPSPFIISVLLFVLQVLISPFSGEISELVFQSKKHEKPALPPFSHLSNHLKPPATSDHHFLNFLPPRNPAIGTNSAHRNPPTKKPKCPLKASSRLSHVQREL